MASNLAKENIRKVRQNWNKLKQEIKLKGQNKSILPRPKQTRAQNKISHYENYSAAEKTKYCFVKSKAPTKLSHLLMQQVKVTNMSYLLTRFSWLQGLDQTTFSV